MTRAAQRLLDSATTTREHDTLFPFPPHSTCKSNATPSKLPIEIKELNNVAVEEQMSGTGESNFNRGHVQGGGGRCAAGNGASLQSKAAVSRALACPPERRPLVQRSDPGHAPRRPGDRADRKDDATPPPGMGQRGWEAGGYRLEGNRSGPPAGTQGCSWNQ